ncbi:MAG: MFS transporter [Reyranellaceae bacterium]
MSGLSQGQRRLAVWLSSGALAMALTGDQLLYIVLPLAADSFGVSLAWVGVLLSANRWIRVALYSEVARFGNRVGPRRLTIVAALGAVASTAAYGLLDGGPLLLAARVVWGLSFAALNLTTLVYAIAGQEQAGRMVGTSRAIREIGPIMAAASGAWLATSLGPREAFWAMTALTLLAIPMALALPRQDPAEAAPAAPRRFRLNRPSTFNLFSFAVGLAGDGIFMVTIGLLFLQEVSAQMAMLSAGAVMALRHLTVLVVSPVGGLLADRFGARRTMLVSGLAMTAGFALVPFDLVYPAALLMLVGRGIGAVVAPLIVARTMKGDVMTAVSANATWADLGAAVGPLLAGFSVGLISLGTLYGGAAALLFALLMIWAVFGRQ